MTLWLIAYAAFGLSISCFAGFVMGRNGDSFEPPEMVAIFLFWPVVILATIANLVGSRGE